MSEKFKDVDNCNIDKVVSESFGNRTYKIEDIKVDVGGEPITSLIDNNLQSSKPVGPSNSEIKSNDDKANLILCSALFFAMGFMVGIGFILYLSSSADLLARCNSMGGDYGNGKCYVNGVEK